MSGLEGTPSNAQFRENSPNIWNFDRVSTPERNAVRAPRRSPSADPQYKNFTLNDREALEVFGALNISDGFQFDRNFVDGKNEGGVQRDFFCGSRPLHAGKFVGGNHGRWDAHAQVNTNSKNQRNCEGLRDASGARKAGNCQSEDFGARHVANIDTAKTPCTPDFRFSDSKNGGSDGNRVRRGSQTCPGRSEEPQQARSDFHSRVCENEQGGMGSGAMKCVLASEWKEECLTMCGQSLYRSFPCQKDAFDFADYCNEEPNADLVKLTKNWGKNSANGRKNIQGMGEQVGQSETKQGGVQLSETRQSGSETTTSRKENRKQNDVFIQSPSNFNGGLFPSSDEESACGLAQYRSLLNSIQSQPSSNPIPNTDTRNSTVHQQDNLIKLVEPQQQKSPQETFRNVSTDNVENNPRVMDESVRIFSEEAKHEKGYSRRFVAATYKGLWAKMQGRDMSNCHFYEVVREGRPCHLYLDLEYKKGCNKHIDGEALVDKVLNRIDALLRETWALSLKDSLIMDLDATTSEKFSRHIIIRLGGCAFENNRSIGAFVCHMISESDPGDFQVKYNHPQSPITSFIDTAVYSRNRAFRTVWSCKAGKFNPLLPRERYSFACNWPDRRVLFLMSLICNVDKSARLLEFQPPLTRHWYYHNPSVDRSVYVPHPTSPHGSHEQSPSIKLTMSVKKGKVVSESVQSEALKLVPMIEKVGQDRTGGLNVEVRTIGIHGDTGHVTYGLGGPGSHFCLNIGRAHKSNHTYLLVNFQTREYCQKCHDPNCAGFKSEWMALPESDQDSS